MLNNFKYFLIQKRMYYHVRPENRYNVPYDLLPWNQRNEWTTVLIGSVDSHNLLNLLQNFLNDFEDNQLYAVYFVYQAPNGTKSLCKSTIMNKDMNAQEILYDILMFIEWLIESYALDLDGKIFARYCKVYNVKRKRVNVMQSMMETHSTNINILPKHLVDGSLWPNTAITSTTVYNNNILAVTKMGEEYIVKLAKNDLRLVSEFKDRIMSDGSFVRTIGNYTIYFNSNNSIVKWNYNFSLKNLKSSRTTSKLNKKFLTFDIECWINSVDGFHTPFAVGFYDGENTHIEYSYGAMDNSLIKRSIVELLSKHPESIVYVHNLGGYDANFLLKDLDSLFHLIFIRHDGNILAIQCFDSYYSGKSSEWLRRNRIKALIIFKDSLKLLPSNLRDLCEQYNVPIQKGTIPYLFYNPERFNYIGPIPDYSYWVSEDISKSDYDQLAKEVGNQWNAREALIEYLTADLISLHQVLTLAQKEFFNQFKIDILNSLTLPGVGLKIYRTPKYFEGKDLIKVFTPDLDSLLRETFLGGLVDVFKPIVTLGKMFDINSSYASSMLHDMPVGNPRYESKADWDDNWFGFIKVKVRSPITKYPVLPIKLLKKVVCPIGEFEWYGFSEELRYAISRGYQIIEVYHGVRFERGKDIFPKYVYTMYYGKANAQSNAQRWMYKQLLNCLYGLWGLKPLAMEAKVVDKAKHDELLEFGIDEPIPLTDGRYLVDVDKRVWSDLDDELFESDALGLRNIAISSAISAYSRIKLNTFRLLPGNEAKYMDTDSVVVDSDLPPEMIGKELGLMKFENHVHFGLFLAPKLYYALDVTQEVKVKNKGSKIKLTLAQFIELYLNNPITITSERWFKSLARFGVYTKSIALTYNATFTKRVKIFNSEGIWIDTCPITVIDDVIIRDNIFFPDPSKPLNISTTPPLRLTYIPKLLLTGRVGLPEVIYLEPPLSKVIYLTGPSKSIYINRTELSKILEMRQNLINILSCPQLIACINRKGSTILFNSIKEAARKTGFSRNSVRKSLRSGIYIKGYKFSYYKSK